MIQGYASSLWEKSYNAFAPGSRIPEWFADQSMGCSVKVELPSHWYNTKLLGMAVCVVVGVNGVTDPSTCSRIYFDSTINISLNVAIKVIGFYGNIGNIGKISVDIFIKISVRLKFFIF